jgi:hypothetical protein
LVNSLNTQLIIEVSIATASHVKINVISLQIKNPNISFIFFFSLLFLDTSHSASFGNRADNGYGNVPLLRSF